MQRPAALLLCYRWVNSGPRLVICILLSEMVIIQVTGRHSGVNLRLGLLISGPLTVHEQKTAKSPLHLLFQCGATRTSNVARDFYRLHTMLGRGCKTKVNFANREWVVRYAISCVTSTMLKGVGTPKVGGCISHQEGQHPIPRRARGRRLLIIIISFSSYV